MMNIINGGSHSDSPIAFQEFMIRPVGAKSFHEALRMGAEVFHALKTVLKKRGLSTAVGDEGGFAPVLDGTEDALNCILAAIEAAGYEPFKHITIGLDCASSEFYHDGIYDYTKFEGTKGEKRTASEQVAYLEKLCWDYPIDSIEDGMAENDWEGWAKASRILTRTTLCGDDLTVTNIEKLKKAVDMGACGSFIFKPNQVGTVTEAMAAQKYAIEHGMFSVPSIRAGGVSDDPVADMGTAGGAAAVKLGPPKFGHAIHIVNSLLRAESEIEGSKPFDFTPFIKWDK